jgi:hypothetical protein
VHCSTTEASMSFFLLKFTISTTYSTKLSQNPTMLV